jgi:hypothetical protein
MDRGGKRLRHAAFTRMQQVMNLRAVAHSKAGRAAFAPAIQILPSGFKFTACYRPRSLYKQGNFYERNNRKN